MSPVAHLFGEDVARADVSRDMAKIHLLGLDAVVNSAVLEVDVTHALGACALRPVDRPLVINVEAGGAIGVREVLGMCGSGVLTPDQVPLSLGEMGGPTTGFRQSERTPVEPLVAFKRDTNIARVFTRSRVEFTT